MESAKILIDYFSMFKMCEEKGSNDSNTIAFIDNIIDVLNESKDKTNKISYIVDFDKMLDIAEKYDVSTVIKDFIFNKYEVKIDNINNDPYLKEIYSVVKKGKDSVLYDLFLNICKYNVYVMNKTVKTQTSSLDQDINFDSNSLLLKDILNYLEVSESSLDKNLLDDLINYSDINDLRQFAISIKTDTGLKRVIFDKTEDKNVLMAILLHSNLQLVDNVIKIFEKEHANLNRVVNNIPSIFIKDLVSNKCKYNNILCNYENFMDNYELIQEYNVDFKKTLNNSVFFLNDPAVNKKMMEKLDSIEV